MRGFNGSVFYEQEEVMVVFGVLQGSYCGCVLYVRKPTDRLILRNVWNWFIYMSLTYTVWIFMLCVLYYMQFGLNIPFLLILCNNVVHTAHCTDITVNILFPKVWITTLEVSRMTVQWRQIYKYVTPMLRFFRLFVIDLGPIKFLPNNLIFTLLKDARCNLLTSTR